MIPRAESSNVIISGDISKSKFEIASDDAAHIMTILGSTLYSDKIAAVLREYGTNAIDAHVEAGIRERPISVNLPTHDNRTLSIRDYGHGLSHEEVFGIFKRFGGSTKRNSDAVTGMLGIGSKAGWAYRNSFTVISRHGGKCRTYVATAGDAGQAGDISFFDEQDCDVTDTGLEIKISVNATDVSSFQSKAAEVYCNFSPRPNFNIAVKWTENTPDYKTKDGVMFLHNKTWTAVMGNVSYPVRLDLLRVSTPVLRCGGTIFAPIGALDVAASREALKYSDRTVAFLQRTITSIVEQFIIEQIKNINSTATSLWHKRILSQRLNKIGSSHTVNRFGNLSVTEVRFQVPKSMQIHEMSYDKIRKVSSDSSYIPVRETTRLVFHNTRRALKTYELQQYDIIFVNKDRKDKCDSVLQALITDIGCDGITVVNTSELPKAEISIKEKPPRSKSKIFILDRSSIMTESDPRKHWCEVESDLSSDDLWVEIKNFRALYTKEFLHMCKHDANFAQLYKIPLPRIIGYVSSKQKNKKSSQKIGESYFDWRKNFYAYVKMHAPIAIKQHQCLVIYEKLHCDVDDKCVKFLETRLQDHMQHDLVKTVMRVFQQLAELNAMHEKLTSNQKWQLQFLNRFASSENHLNSIDGYQQMQAKLPLLFANSDGLKVLITDLYRNAWIQYIIDVATKG